MNCEQESHRIFRAPKDLLWPDERRVAVVFNFAYEMWAPETTSGVGPMGNVLADGVFDPNADSYGRYGATSGIHRLLRMAEENGISASVLTSGMVAEQCPDHVRKIASAGHEIVGHSYAQNLLSPALTPYQDLTYIVQSTELLEKATSQHPSGWISPRVTSGPSTHRRLVKQGYTWHGDALDDDLPYIQRFPEGDIVAIPMSVEFNDLPHAMRFGRTPTQFVELFVAALDGIRIRPAETIILDVFAHGHCYGRPAAAWAIDEIMKRCADQQGLWLTTRSAIADHFKTEMRKCMPIY